MTPTRRGYSIWGVAVLFFIFEFILRTVVGTFEHPITYQLELNAVQFSVISSSAFLAIYALMQMPAGWLLDRIGLRIALVSASLFCALACVLFASAHTFEFSFIARMLMGFGASFGFLCVLSAICEYLPDNRRASLIGFSQFLGTLGPMLAAGPLAALASGGSDDVWRTVFCLFGALSVGIAILAYFVIRSPEQISTKMRFVKLSVPTPVSQSLFRLVRGRQNWLIALYCAGTYSILEYLSENGGRLFLSLKGASDTDAGFLISLGWLTYGLSAPCLGMLSDRLMNRKSVLVGAGLVGVLGIMLFNWASSLPGMALGCLALGVGAAGQTIGFVMMAENCQKGYLGFGLSFNNMFLSLGVAINAPLVGLFFSHARAERGVLALSDYQTGFTLLVLISAASVLLAMLGIRETFGKSQHHPTVLSRR